MATYSDINKGQNQYILANGSEMKYYDNNPNLKAAYVQLQFTQHQIEERIKCAKDPIYFIENYVKIMTLDGGIEPFKMWPFQKKLVDAIHNNRFVISKVARRAGKTTTVVSYILWMVLFHPSQTVAILANKASTAKEILSILQRSYERIPLWMQQGVKVWNKGNIDLENSSRILTAPTSSDALRGYGVNFLLLDEFALVPNNIAEEFMTSVYPTISSGTKSKIAIISTPLGMNLFYRMWTDAIHKRNLYFPIEFHWAEVPGRDEKWKEDQIKQMGQQKFDQEYETKFLGSSNTLISGIKLSELTWFPPLQQIGCLDVYERPINDHVYFTIVDCARGQNLDYSAFTVIDATQSPYKMVAKYRNKEIDPYMFPEVIHNVSKTYNEAYALVESNDIGKQVVDILHTELEYENVFSVMNMGRAGQKLSAGYRKGAKLGVATSVAIKRIGCANLKALIESDQLLINDFNIYEELTTFVASKDSFAAEEGSNDDLTMTLVLFGWLTSQQLFKELTNGDIRKRMAEEKSKIDQEKLMPFGILPQDTHNRVEMDVHGTRWVEVAPRDLKDQFRFFNDIDFTVGSNDDDDDGYGGNSL